MDSNLLRVFVAVAQEKSISLGAKKLDFAQSNVTSRIKQLEKNLGFNLFYRVPKGVILTQEGEKLYPHALQIVKKIESTILDMKNIKEQQLLRIGSTESNAVIRIVPFLVQLHRDFPNMELELFTNTTRDITKMLLDYSIDIAFISGEPKNEELIVLNSFREEIVLIDNKNEESSNTFLAFKNGCAYNDFAQDYLKKQGNNQFKLLEFGSYETILGCVDAGMGKAIIPLNIVEKLGYKEKLKILDLEENKINIPTCLVSRKDNIPKIKSYLKQVKLLSLDFG